VILAPFNSTRSHNCVLDTEGEPIPKPLIIPNNMLVDKKCIRFAARVKDIDRQFEINNNCELDNGVYNKFVRQSSEKK